MHRIGHHPRQPACIENAFLQIEFPGPRLLRQKAALQPVGQTPDNALEIGKLLIQMMTQPGQFIRIAKIFGFDDLVVFHRIGSVHRLALTAGAAAIGAPLVLGLLAILVAGAGHHFFLALLGHRFVTVLDIHFLHLGGFGAAHFGGHAFHIGIFGIGVFGGLFFGVFALFAFLLFGGFGLLVDQFELDQEIGQGCGVCFLVVDAVSQLVEIGINLVVDPVTPQADQLFAAFW